MTKEKSALGATGLKALLLAIGITGLPQPSSASAVPGERRSCRVRRWRRSKRLPLSAVFRCCGRSLGSLPRPTRSAWFSAATVHAAIDQENGSSAAQGNAGIDPIQTAAIIPGVFGSVALSMHNFPVSARWAPVYRAIVDCSTGSACDGKNSIFAAIVNVAKDKRFIDKLSFINSSINHAIAYKKDSVVYGKLDYWAKPSEILEHRAGDCEDFAILKMAALLRAGIPAQSMSLVVLQDRKRGFFHAVLSVSTGSGVFILDSLSNVVSRDSDLPDYVPLYSFSTDRAWIHGARAGAAQVADIKGGLATVAPGEGLQP